MQDVVFSSSETKYAVDKLEYADVPRMHWE